MIPHRLQAHAQPSQRVRLVAGGCIGANKEDDA